MYLMCDHELYDSVVAVNAKSCISSLQASEFGVYI